MRSRAGKTSEQRRLFEREALPCLDAIYTAALHLARNQDDAKDLLQETALRAYRFFHQFAPGTNCRAWMLTILYNVFRNSYRRAAREQVSSAPSDLDRGLIQESERSEGSTRDPESLVLDSVMDHEVEAALDGLPEEFRAVLMLVDVQELSYQETAAVLAVPIGTVRSRLSRGRAIMRQSLDGLARARGILRS